MHNKNIHIIYRYMFNESYIYEYKIRIYIYGIIKEKPTFLKLQFDVNSLCQ